VSWLENLLAALKKASNLSSSPLDFLRHVDLDEFLVQFDDPGALVLARLSHVI